MLPSKNCTLFSSSKINCCISLTKVQDSAPSFKIGTLRSISMLTHKSQRFTPLETVCSPSVPSTKRNTTGKRVATNSPLWKGRASPLQKLARCIVRKWLCRSRRVSLTNYEWTNLNSINWFNGHQKGNSKAELAGLPPAHSRGLAERRQARWEDLRDRAGQVARQSIGGL